MIPQPDPVVECRAGVAGGDEFVDVFGSDAVIPRSNQFFGSEFGVAEAGQLANEVEVHAVVFHPHYQIRGFNGVAE